MGQRALKAILADITTLTVDAVVNAANTTLLGGGGVDGAIHAAAGPGLLDACPRLGGCATGDAKITAGFRLPAKFIIHTVGPIWRGGAHREEELLASCYRRCLELAAQESIASLAFPSISTGAYAFPIDQAVPIAITSSVGFSGAAPALREIVFCCHSARDLAVYSSVLATVS